MGEFLHPWKSWVRICTFSFFGYMHSVSLLYRKGCRFWPTIFRGAETHPFISNIVHYFAGKPLFWTGCTYFLFSNMGFQSDRLTWTYPVLISGELNMLIFSTFRSRRLLLSKSSQYAYGTHTIRSHTELEGLVLRIGRLFDALNC